MVDERQGQAEQDDHDAGDDTPAEQVRDRVVDPLRFRLSCRAVHPRTPCTSIWIETPITTTTAMRTARLLTRPRTFDPRNAPVRTPMLTGAAMNGSICPRAK